MGYFSSRVFPFCVCVVALRACVQEHVEKMRSDVRSTVLREEQLLDLMIEFVQRGERKGDIQYVVCLTYGAVD